MADEQVGTEGGAEEAVAEKQEGGSTAARIAELREKVAAGETVFDRLPEGKEPFGDNKTVDAPPFEIVEEEAKGAEEQQVAGEATGEAEAEVGTAAEAESAAEGSKEAGEVEEAAKEGEVAEGEAETFVAHLPGRGPDDPDIEIELEDQELAERVRQMANGYERSFQLRQRQSEVTAREGDLAAIQQEAKDDPVGFVLDHVDASHHPEIAKQILANPTIYAELAKELAEWSLDPATRETFAEGARADRAEQKVKREGRRADRTRANAAANMAGEVIVEIALGNGLDDQRGGQFYSMAMKALGEHLEETRTLDLKDEDVARILSTRGIVDAFQVDPKKRAKSRAGTTAEDGTRRLTPLGPTEEEIATARGTGTRMKRAVEKKRDVAAVASPGEGAATSTLPIKAGESVKDRIKLARKGGIARLLGPR